MQSGPTASLPRGVVGKVPAVLPSPEVTGSSRPTYFFFSFFLFVVVVHYQAEQRWVHLLALHNCVLLWFEVETLSHRRTKWWSTSIVWRHIRQMNHAIELCYLPWRFSRDVYLTMLQNCVVLWFDVIRAVHLTMVQAYFVLWFDFSRAVHLTMVYNCVVILAWLFKGCSFDDATELCSIVRRFKCYSFDDATELCCSLVRRYFYLLLTCYLWSTAGLG